MCMLVLNALMPLGAHALTSALAPGEYVEVCSSTGMVMVPVSQGEAAPKGSGPLDFGKHCPLCHLAGHDLYLPPSTAYVPAVLGFHEMPTAFLQAEPTSTVWLAARSRAPPQSF